MIAGRDSSFFRPSAAQLQQAKAAGVGIWGGYLTTKPNVGIASPWDQASFDRVRSVLGTIPLAFASGWDDPAALKAKAASWRVRLCLDDEGGIRAGLSEEQYRRRLEVRGPRRVDGSWVQPWLDASGAGLYGNGPVFDGRRAPFFVVAAYPAADPHRVWPQGHPAVPCGWQWQGTHTEFGGGCDSAWYDDSFLQGGDELLLNNAVKRGIVRLAGLTFLGRHWSAADHDYWTSKIADDGSNLDQVLTLIEDSAEGAGWDQRLDALRAGTLQGQKGDKGDRGDPGPAYDDSALKSALAEVQAQLQAIKGAIK